MTIKLFIVFSCIINNDFVSFENVETCRLSELHYKKK